MEELLRPAKLVEQTISDGKCIRARKIGNGPHLLFLIPGMSNNWYAWTAVTDHDQKDMFTFISIDVLGYGDSDRARKYSYIKQGNAIREFVGLYLKNDKRKYRSIGLGGYSMGAIITNIVSTVPNQIDYYIFMSPVFKNRMANFGSLFLTQVGSLAERIWPAKTIYKHLYMSRFMTYSTAYLFGMYRFNRGIINKYCIEGKKISDFNAYLRMSKDLHRLDLMEIFNSREQNAKYLVIVGEHDSYLNVPKFLNGEIVDIENENLTIEEIKGVGHVPLYEDSISSYNIIREYVERNYGK